MESSLQTQAASDLFQAMANLKSKAEVRNFMRDLCTIGELQDMTERWQVAKRLTQGIPYRKIAKETGSSTATITRVAHWLHHGMGGYSLMLQRLGELNHRRRA